MFIGVWSLSNIDRRAVDDLFVSVSAGAATAEVVHDDRSTLFTDIRDVRFFVAEVSKRDVDAQLVLPSGLRHPSVDHLPDSIEERKEDVDCREVCRHRRSEGVATFDSIEFDFRLAH